MCRGRKGCIAQQLDVLPLLPQPGLISRLHLLLVWLHYIVTVQDASIVENVQQMSFSRAHIKASLNVVLLIRPLCEPLYDAS
jgi:hypothetical protein